MNKIAAILSRYPPEVVAAVMNRYPHGVTGPRAIPQDNVSKAVVASRRDTRREAVEKLNAMGWTVNAMVGFLGCGSRTVRADLAFLGLQPNQTHPHKGQYRSLDAAARRVQVARLVKDIRLTQAQIAGKLGVTVGTVKNDLRIIRRNGAPHA